MLTVEKILTQTSKKRLLWCVQ